jgi:redox-sensitive bicupin YhaK (pirin superfamily)
MAEAKDAAGEDAVRRVVKTITLRTQTEGGGFTIRRSIGSSQLSSEETDPFLMLDELPVTEYAPGEFPGAPWHPHRGMDTVMYFKQVLSSSLLVSQSL